MLVTHVVSVSMTEVAYMVSVKRTSLLFGVVLGYLLFREGRIRERFAGAALMLAGFVLVVLSA
jgi:drug/metabolite transporter (DMT)-like permease